jgi:hypothetical protein
LSTNYSLFPDHKKDKGEDVWYEMLYNTQDK